MKMDSVYRRTMDAVRPAPERRDAMLQAILNHKAKPAARRRWALGAVTAAVVVLAMAWGGGAFAPVHTAEPDIVTQGNVDTTASTMPSPMPTVKLGAVQWLPNVTLASPDVANNLPDKLVLVRSALAELSESEVEDVKTALEAKGWDTVKLDRADEGYYKLTAHRAASIDSTSGEHVIEVEEHSQQISELFRLIAAKRSVRLLGDRPKAYAGLRLTLAPQSDALGLSYEGDETDVSVEADFTLWRDEQLGSADALPPQEALKNAFYVLGGHPALDADAAMQLSSLNFVCVSGVPCYQFPVQTANGMRYGYALAVDQKDLNAIPELAAIYRRFLNGETMQIDVILQSPVYFDQSPQMTRSAAQPLPNLELPSEQTDFGLPKQVTLLDSRVFKLDDGDIAQVVQRLNDKGWRNVVVSYSDDTGFALCTEGAGSAAVLYAEKHMEMARQFMADSGLAELLARHGMELEHEPGSRDIYQTLYRARIKGLEAPGCAAQSEKG